MENRINKTSICCIVFLDIVDYSKKTDAEQIEIKDEFNRLISQSLNNVAQNDRIILDTGDGAAITYMGSPEDALFMAISIRDGIIKNNLTDAMPLYVRFGINLGPVRVVNDINGQLNVIGDGINVAQRIMSFAKPNEILVSRSYFELTSRLTDEISKLFNYSGVYQDKHVREHEVYTVRLVVDHAIEEQSSLLADSVQSVRGSSFLQKINWQYALSGAAILLALIFLVNLLSTTAAPEIKVEPQVVTKPPVSTEAKSKYLTPSESLVDVATIKSTAKSKKANITKDALADTQLSNIKDYSEQKQVLKGAVLNTKPKPVKKEVQVSADNVQKKVEVTQTRSAEQVAVEETAKSQQVKKHTHRVCNQAEILMNQCR